VTIRQTGCMSENAELLISLTRDEALVLFELLHRLEDAGDLPALLLEHQAEQIALSNLSCVLERLLVEPFQRDYKALLEAARARLSAT
jgi:hypothetical protein